MSSTAVESIVLFLLVGPYALFVRAVGLSHAAALALGCSAAVGSLQLWTSLLLFAGMSTVSGLTLGLTVITGVCLCVLGRGGDPNATIADARQVGSALVALAIVLVTFAKLLNLPRVTPDSIVHLAHVRALRRGDGSVLNSVDLFERGIGTSSLHALGNLFDADLFMSAAIALSCATTTLCFCLIREVQRRLGLADRHGIAVALGSTGLLVFSDRFIFVSLLLNHHSLVALSYLSITFILVTMHGSTSLSRLTTRLAGTTLALVSFSSLAARRESVLIICFIAALASWSGLADTRSRMRLGPTWLLSLTVMAAIWCVVVIKGQQVDLPQALALPALPFMALLAVVAVNNCSPSIKSLRPVFLALMAFLSFVLLATSFFDNTRDLRLLSSSIAAVADNVLFSGGWRFEWGVVGAALVASLPGRDETVDFVRYTVVGIVLIHLGLPMVTGGAYRIGPGDSFNRMLTHVLPLAVVYVGATLSIGGSGTLGPTKQSELEGNHHLSGGI